MLFFFDENQYFFSMENEKIEKIEDGNTKRKKNKTKDTVDFNSIIWETIQKIKYIIKKLVKIPVKTIRVFSNLKNNNFFSSVFFCGVFIFIVEVKYI